MATVLQLGAKPMPRGSQLHPTLKEFLDEVVIPALVKAYLMESDAENRLAIMPNNVPKSASENSLPIKVIL